METMAASYDLIIRGGIVVNHDGEGPRDIGVTAGRVAAIGDLGAAAAGEAIDAKGLHVLPGVIDSQVHFREPGLTHKEDLETGSRSAVLGGVTAVFEMPNTNPLTTSADALADKVARGRHRMHCDFAFYVGGTRDNTRDLPERERKDERIDNDPRSHPVWRDELVALQCTQRLVALARETGRRIHVLHVTTAQEMTFLGQHKDVASVEVTPHHLTLAAPDCYERLGTLAQMNPPVRDATHRAAIWRGLEQGVVDVLGSDHAPHTRDEKAKPYPASPSGMTGVQTLVPLMLDHVNAGRLTLARLVDLTSAGPTRLFGIARKGRIAVGYDADLTIVDLKRRATITDRWIASRAGWTPYDNTEVVGWPVGTFIRGHKVMWEGEVTGAHQGEA